MTQDNTDITVFIWQYHKSLAPANEKLRQGGTGKGFSQLLIRKKKQKRPQPLGIYIETKGRKKEL